MNRRNFLLAGGALALAPAIVRAESLMRVVVPRPLTAACYHARVVFFPERPCARIDRDDVLSTEFWVTQGGLLVRTKTILLRDARAL